MSMGKVASAILTVVVASGTVIGTATVGQADTADQARGKYYSSCDKLTKDFKHGVAKSRKAAQQQVNQGYGRPSFTSKAKSVYRTNKSRLDRDNDGTACER